MDISISEQIQQLIKQKVESGHYSSPDEIMDTALRLLDERDKKLEALRKDVQVGLDQLERGEYVEYTDETLDQLFDKLEAEAFKNLETQPHTG